MRNYVRHWIQRRQRIRAIRKAQEIIRQLMKEVLGESSEGFHRLEKAWLHLGWWGLGYPNL